METIWVISRVTIYDLGNAEIRERESVGFVRTKTEAIAVCLKKNKKSSGEFYNYDYEEVNRLLTNEG